MPYKILTQILANQDLNFDLIESRINECIDADRVILGLNQLPKNEEYKRKNTIYQMQLLLTVIRNRHLPVIATG